MEPFRRDKRHLHSFHIERTLDTRFTQKVFIERDAAAAYNRHFTVS